MGDVSKNRDAGYLQEAGIDRIYMCKIDAYVKQAMQDANVQCAPKTSAAELKAMYQDYMMERMEDSI
ncbi:MAG: hypothetical protein ACLTJG_01600 [[Clostridium] innocuum]